jgi:hypothetical protein
LSTSNTAAPCTAAAGLTKNQIKDKKKRAKEKAKKAAAAALSSASNNETTDDGDVDDDGDKAPLQDDDDDDDDPLQVVPKLRRRLDYLQQKGLTISSSDIDRVGSPGWERRLDQRIAEIEAAAAAATTTLDAIDAEIEAAASTATLEVIDSTASDYKVIVQSSSSSSASDETTTAQASTCAATAAVAYGERIASFSTLSAAAPDAVSDAKKTKTRHCDHCNATSTTNEDGTARRLQKCCVCRVVYYCNMTCSTAAGKRHKLVCKPKAGKNRT